MGPLNWSSKKSNSLMFTGMLTSNKKMISVDVDDLTEAKLNLMMFKKPYGDRTQKILNLTVLSERHRKWFGNIEQSRLSGLGIAKQGENSWRQHKLHEAALLICMCLLFLLHIQRSFCLRINKHGICLVLI